MIIFFIHITYFINVYFVGAIFNALLYYSNALYSHWCLMISIIAFKTTTFNIYTLQVSDKC